MHLEKFKQQIQRGGARNLRNNLTAYRDLVRQYWRMKTKLRNSISQRTGKPLAEDTIHSYRASLKSYEACLDVSKHMITAQVRKRRKSARPQLRIIKGGKGKAPSENHRPRAS